MGSDFLTPRSIRNHVTLWLLFTLLMWSRIRIPFVGFRCCDLSPFGVRFLRLMPQHFPLCTAPLRYFQFSLQWCHMRVVASQITGRPTACPTDFAAPYYWCFRGNLSVTRDSLTRGPLGGNHQWPLVGEPTVTGCWWIHLTKDKEYDKSYRGMAS